jgi:hypothetical protein
MPERLKLVLIVAIAAPPLARSSVTVLVKVWPPRYDLHQKLGPWA